MVAKDTQGSFLEYQNNKISIYTQSIADVGSYQCEVIASLDRYNVTTVFTFVVEINGKKSLGSTNSAPYFAGFKNT